MANRQYKFSIITFMFLVIYAQSCAGKGLLENAIISETGAVTVESVGYGASSGGTSQVFSFGKEYKYQFDLRNCSDSDALVVSNSSELNKAIKDRNILTICLKPGVYDKKQDIKRGGTKSKELLLRPYIDNGAPPWNLPEKSLPKFTNRVHIADAQYVIINGIFFKPAYITVDSYVLTGNSHIVFDSILTEGNIAQNQMLIRDSFNIWVQNSVMRRTARVPRKDRLCINVTRTAGNINVVNNEIYDCGDGFQLHRNGAAADVDQWSLSGANIIANHFYQTEYSYVKCPDNVTAMCSSGENAIDIKLTSDDGVPTRIAHNIFNGFRETNTNYGSTGSDGAAIAVHGKKVQNLLIEKNRFFDSASGIIFTGVDPGLHCALAKDNLFDDIAHAKKISNSYPILYTHVKEYMFFVNNTIVVPKYTNHDYVWGGFRGNLNKSLIAQNLIIGHAREKYKVIEMTQETAILKNTFVNTRRSFSNQEPHHNLEYSGINYSDWFHEDCFTINPLTDPKIKCINNVIPKKGSKAGFLGKASINILNEHPEYPNLIQDFCPALSDYLESDLLNEPRPLEATPGAFNPQ